MLFEGYLRARACLDEDSVIVAKKNSKVLPNISLDAIGGNEHFKANLESRLGDGLSLIQL